MTSVVGWIKLATARERYSILDYKNGNENRIDKVLAEARKGGHIPGESLRTRSRVRLRRPQREPLPVIQCVDDGFFSTGVTVIGGIVGYSGTLCRNRCVRRSSLRKTMRRLSRAD